MKRALEKTISIGLGVIILVGLAGVVLLIFGGSLLTALTFVLGLPMAMPMTSALVIGVLVVILIVRKRK